MIENKKEQDIQNNNVVYWNNAIIHWIAIVTVFIIVGVAILFVFYIHPSETLIKLQYNVFFGTSLRAPWWQVYSLPAVAIIFFGIDLVIGYILYKSGERIASYIVMLGGLFAAVALFIAAIGIVFNNHSL